MYKFTVRASSHLRSNEIYEMLDSFRQRLELDGYIHDTSFVLQDVDEELRQQMLYSHN